jgi:hypothetical protein
MSNLTISYSSLSRTIRVGKVNKSRTAYIGKKTDVTEDAIRSAAEYLLFNDVSFYFTDNKTGKRYAMTVKEGQNEELDSVEEILP